MTTSMGRQQLLEVETTCGSLLNDLQLIWDEVGESDEERDQMLLELEQECLEVYRRKVNQANNARAQLHQSIAEIHSEIVALSSSLGDRLPMTQLEMRASSLKAQIGLLNPLLEDMRGKIEERLKEFLEIATQIHSIQFEIAPSSHSTKASMDALVNEQDLTERKLDELKGQLHLLQMEKSDRLQRILEYVKTVQGLCAVLDSDFSETIREVHPSLDESFGSQNQNISNETIDRLAITIQSLREEKKRRMQKIQDLGASLLELWNLMDTSIEEQVQFQHVTCNIAAAEHEVVAKGSLSFHVIEQVAAEVERLDQLKASKMKELVLKKRTELEEICRKAHIILDGDSTQDEILASMESGTVDPGELLAIVEDQIGTVKEEVFSRKEIMEKIEKWISICEEESWLEDYNKDENRYNATRGAHLNLKRAERARAAIAKIPALVDSLIAKAKAWEEERGKPFLYDGVRLLSTVEEYNILRLEKEEERRRQRDQRRLHEQLVNEQETLFGTRPSPNSRTPLKKVVPGTRLNGASTPASHASRRLSLGGAMLQSAVGQEPAVRVNGMMTPGRTVTPGGKDSRHKATPASANRVFGVDDDDLHTPGIVTSKVLYEMDSSFLSAGARQPLSPVSHAPGMRANANVEDIQSKGQSAFTALKPVASIMKSPLSTVKMGRPTATVMDEENATPQKQIASQIVSHQQPTQLQQTASQLQQPPVFEYSLEERRLAYLHSELHMRSRTDCR